MPQNRQKKSTNSAVFDKNAKLSTTYKPAPMITFWRKMAVFRKNCTFARLFEA